MRRNRVPVVSIVSSHVPIAKQPKSLWKLGGLTVSQLGRNVFDEIIENTGDLPKALATFQYVIAKDSTYPLFYYNLACIYAEMKDEPKTAENLKRAFQFKTNIFARRANAGSPDG